jgi:putative FmdB family regulatory protein
VPVYEYACSKCSHHFEELIRNPQDERELKCPECGGSRINRRPSVFATRAASPKLPLPTGGGCGRCGDPAGPCSMP